MNMRIDILLQCLFLINTAVGVHGVMHVKTTVKEKAESTYKSNSLHGPSGNPKDRPVAELSTCLEKIFGVPLPYSPHITTTATPTTTSATISTILLTTTESVVPTRCIYTDGKGKPEVRPPGKHRRLRAEQRLAETGWSQNGSNCKSKVRERGNRRRRRSVQLDEEISKLHRCMCHLSPDSVAKCHFSMLKTGYNKTVLNSSLGAYVTKKARLTYRKKEFHCRLRADFTLVCSIKRNNERDEDTRLQQTLICLSNALEPLVCDAIQTTQAIHPDIPTNSPSQGRAPSRFTTGLIILILGCVLCLLLGILGTVCGVLCYRKRKKKRVQSMVKRTSRQAQLNSYSGNVPDQHIYEDLPDTAVPDLLQRSAGTGAVHTRFGSERSVSVNTTLRTVSYSPGIPDGGYYEPLSRHDEECPIPTKPIPKPRWQFSVPDAVPSGPHDYLDIVEESNHEDRATEGESTDHPYFVLETNESNPFMSDNSDQESHHPKEDYAERGDAKTKSESDINAYDEDNRNSQISDGSNANSSVTNGVKTHDYFVLEKTETGQISHTDASLVASDSITDNCPNECEEAEIIQTSWCLDNDDYEIPVAEVTNFDIASSFKSRAENNGRGGRRYKDYLAILPVVGETTTNMNENEKQRPEYFVLES